MRADRQTLRSAAVFVGTGVIAFGGLWLLARPDQASARLANVAAVAERAQQGGAGVAPPLAAPCRAGVAEAADEVQSSLQAQAAQAGLTLEALEFADLPAPTTDLRGLKVAIRLRGQEAAFATFLRGASEARLPIFLDGADVRRTAAGGLTASFDGRILCRRGGR